MESYKAQAFLHVTIAIVALGSTFAQPLIHGWAEKRGVGATRMALQFSQFHEKLLIVPGSILLLLLGIGLIFDDATGYSDDFPAWLLVSIVWFVIAFAVGAIVQRRNVDSAVAALDGVPDQAEFPAAYTAVSKRLQLTGAFLGLSVIGITFLMIWKPGQ